MYLSLRRRGEPVALALAVDERTNSLIVQSTDELYEDIKKLANSLDLSAKDTKRKVEIRSAQASAGLGIAVIFQEFSLVPHLDVAQNIYLGRAAKLRGLPGFINRRQIYQDARRHGMIAIDSSTMLFYVLTYTYYGPA